MTRLLSDLEHYEKVRDGWLLDTSIVSSLVAQQPLPASAAHFFERIDDTRFHLSVITLGEVHRALFALPLPAELSMASLRESAHFQQAQRLKELATIWGDRIHPVNEDVAYKWGSMLSIYAKDDTRISAVDVLVAATAAVHNLVVVTRDAGFRRMLDQVSVYDPWSPA